MFRFVLFLIVCVARVYMRRGGTYDISERMMILFSKQRKRMRMIKIFCRHNMRVVVSGVWNEKLLIKIFIYFPIEKSVPTLLAIFGFTIPTTVISDIVSFFSEKYRK